MIKFLDFYADWCGPCIIMKPTVEEIEKEFAGRVTVEKINVEKNPILAGEFQIFSIPTYVILKNNKEVDRLIGAVGKNRLVSTISKYLGKS